MENIKKPMEAGMLCMIDGEIFCFFTKDIWIGDSGASYHITNDNMGLCDVTEVN